MWKLSIFQELNDVIMMKCSNLNYVCQLKLIFKMVDSESTDIRMFFIGVFTFYSHIQRICVFVTQFVEFIKFSIKKKSLFFHLLRNFQIDLLICFVAGNIKISDGLIFCFFLVGLWWMNLRMKNKNPLRARNI